MYHLKTTLHKGVAITALIVMSAAPSLALAVEGYSSPSPTVSKSPQTTVKEKAMEKKAEVKEKIAARLTDAKLKVCQNRERAIQKRSTQLTKLSEKMLTTFDKIATRVQTYYTNTVVPTGRTVENYDGLVTEIATQKAAAQTALTTAQAAVESFTCAGEDPKGQLTAFNEQMKAVKKALKDYRTAVRNLIVAVHSNKGKGTPTPGVSSSPKASPSASASPAAE